MPPGRIFLVNGANGSRQISEFVRAFDHAVTGQDLLDQGRARARQADDEYRRWIRIPVALILLEKLGRKGFDNAIVDDLSLDRVVVFVDSAHRVAAIDITECALIFATVFVGFAEREIETDLCFLE